MKKWIFICFIFLTTEHYLMAASKSDSSKKLKIQQNEKCFKYITIKTENGDVTITNTGTQNNPNFDIEIGTPVFKFNASNLYHIEFDKLKNVENILSLNQMRSKKDNLWYQFKSKNGPMASLGSQQVSQIAFVKNNGSNEIYNDQNILVYSHGSFKIKDKNSRDIIEPIEVSSLMSTPQEIQACLENKKMQNINKNYKQNSKARSNTTTK